jgi:hypothetical protein
MPKSPIFHVPTGLGGEEAASSAETAWIGHSISLFSGLKSIWAQETSSPSSKESWWWRQFRACARDRASESKDPGVKPDDRCGNPSYFLRKKYVEVKVCELRNDVEPRTLFEGREAHHDILVRRKASFRFFKVFLLGFVTYPSLGTLLCLHNFSGHEYPLLRLLYQQTNIV